MVNNHKLVISAIAVMVFAVIGSLVFIAFQKSIVELPKVRCTADKTMSVPLAFYRMNFIHDEGDQITIDFSTFMGKSITSPHGYEMPVMQSNLYDFNFSTLDLKPSNLVPFGHKVESYRFGLKGTDIFIVTSQGRKYFARFKSKNKNFLLPLPDEREQRYPGFNNQFELISNDKYLLVVEGCKLMRWRLEKKGAKKISDLRLPMSGNFPVNVFQRQEPDKLYFSDSELAVKSFDIETGKVESVSKLPGMPAYGITGECFFDNQKRCWTIDRKTSTTSITCRENDKVVFESMVHGQRDLATTGIPPLDDFLVSLGHHTVYESKNWNFPPAIFAKLLFDKQNTPILLTVEEGLFKLQNGEWKRLFLTADLGVNAIFDMIWSQDGKICLFTEAPYYGFPEKDSGKKFAIVIFDPVKNEYQILRIKLTG